MAIHIHKNGHHVRWTLIETHLMVVNFQMTLFGHLQLLLIKLKVVGIKMEKEKAFDLLDALSRSGSLSVSCSELHVVISVTHCFEKDVMGTVIQDNMNPIEKLEMSTLLVASLIHGIPAHSLIRDDNEKLRLATSFPAMLGSASESQDDV